MSTLPSMIPAKHARAWAWWLVPVVALGALIGWEIDWGRQVVRLPPAPPPIEPKPVAAALLPEYAIEGGLPANGETVNRTLFNATRRPAPVLAAESGPRTLKPGQFLLVGTTVTGERNIAFLKEVAGGKSRTVRQGEEINGMLVASVTSDKVKLTLGDESEELILKVAPGPKTTLAAAPPPPAAVASTGAPATPAPANRVAPSAGQIQPATAAQPQQPASRPTRRAARAAAAQGAGGADQGGGSNMDMQRRQGK